VTATAAGQALARPAIPRDSYLLAGSLFLIVSTTNIMTPLLPDIRRTSV
jgi:hypothetical protein